MKQRSASIGSAPVWAAVAAGAALLVWPAAWNGYPILFSDTGGFLEQALMPDPGWDKPWVYGPLLTPFHLLRSLWGAVAAQGLILSAMLWMAAAALGRAGPAQHLGLCLLLAGLSAAPWFAALLMPDILAPVTVLGLFVLSTPGAGRWGLIWVGTMTALAIAAHLAHLVVAACCLAVLAATGRRPPWRGLAALACAVLLLLLTNRVGHGVLALSPYGQDFALARMVADGPAARVIRRACPAAGWHVCAFADRLPTDSDDFLWDPHGPVWGGGYGPLRLAPEAATIVRRTMLEEPGGLLLAGLRNTGRQLLMVQVGDTLTGAHLEATILPRLIYFPPAEAARFLAGRQMAGTLPHLAAALWPLHAAALAAGLAGTLLVAVRGEPAARRFAVLVLVALLANAAATGALSRPNDRYQARIAWLLLLPPVWALMPRARPAPAGPARRHPAGGGSCGG